MVQLEQQEPRAQLELQARVVLLVRVVHKGLQEQLEQRVPKVSWDILVWLVPVGKQAVWDKVGNLDHKVHRVLKECWVVQDHRVSRVQLVRLDRLDRQD